MINRYCWALCIFLLLGLVVFTYAEDDEDITRSLTMTCDYSDYGKYQRESVSIAQTEDDQGKPAAVKRFKRGGPQRQKEIFIVPSRAVC